MIKNYRFLLPLLGLYFSGTLTAQNNSSRDLYNQFDTVIGIENTDLYNGISYKELHQIDPDQNKFLFPKDMRSGDIVYDSKTYYDIKMNYNIYDDVVLVKLESKLSTHTFQLISDKIERFKVSNSEYVRIVGNLNENISSGFYEVLLTDEDNEINLLKKHRLKEKKNLNNEVSIYTYRKREGEFVLEKSGELFSVKDRGDFQELFPKHRNEISSFYKDYSSLRRSNYSKFMVNLVSLLIKQN